MTEATWGPATPPAIDWTMSAALENVSIAGQDLPEVTNLAAAVRAWRGLTPDQQADAVLTLERPIKLSGGMPLDSLLGGAIGDLAERLPG